MTSESNTATLIVVRGLPGSGKTHLAKALQQKLGQDCAVLDPDEVDQTSSGYKAHVAQATAEGVEPKLHLYRFLRAQAYHAIEAGKTIIWNQPFTNLEIFHKVMQRMKDKAEESSQALNVLIVEVEVDPAKAQKRVSERKQAGGHGPSSRRFTDFVRDYQSFEDEGYKTVQVLGDDDVQNSVQKVTDALSKL